MVFCIRPSQKYLIWLRSGLILKFGKQKPQMNNNTWHIAPCHYLLNRNKAKMENPRFYTFIVNMGIKRVSSSQTLLIKCLWLIDYQKVWAPLSRSFGSLLVWSLQLWTSLQIHSKIQDCVTLREMADNPRTSPQTLQASANMLNDKVHDRTIWKIWDKYGMFGRFARRKPLLSKKKTWQHGLGLLRLICKPYNF